MEVSRLVKKHRTAMGLTQKQLAARAGVAINTVERIETSDRQPDVRTAQLLAAVFGIDWTTFFPPVPDFSTMGAE